MKGRITMSKSLFEETGGTYRQVGDYLIPNINLPEEEKEVHVGIWGMRRKNFLLQNNHVLFSIMFADGTLWKHLAEVDNEAEEMLSRLVTELAKAEGVTEELKENDQMTWVGRMNSIRERATEVIVKEIVFL